MAQDSCSQCGSANIVAGQMHSTGTIRFRPQGTKFLTFHTADVTVNANMCTSCGWIKLVGDTDRLKLLRDSNQFRAGVANSAHGRT